LRYFSCDAAKNETLKAERGDILNIFNIFEHPNQERYRGQRAIIVQIEDYTCALRA
jgi:hypothetical protein